MSEQGRGSRPTGPLSTQCVLSMCWAQTPGVTLPDKPASTSKEPAPQIQGLEQSGLGRPHFRCDLGTLTCAELLLVAKTAAGRGCPIAAHRRLTVDSSQTAWLPIPAQPPAGSVTLGPSLNLFGLLSTTCEC